MPATKAVCVALSGGVDSTVLLHVLAPWARARGIALSAMHVHHGISANADEWARFCASLCDALRVPHQIVRVDISPWRHQGVEAAARAARREALATCGAEHLALAHHQDDQAETVLLQLLRGAGVPGLAGMATERALMLGRRTRDGKPAPQAAKSTTSTTKPPIVVRPMLAVTRAQIEQFARQHGIKSIRDESNDDVAFTRNYLRHTVMPLLIAKQPAAPANLARSALHLAEANALLTELGRSDIRRVMKGQSIILRPLLALGPARTANALRTWIRDENWRVPTTAQLEELIRQLFDARQAARTAFESDEFALRRYRDRLHLVSRRMAIPSDIAIEWNGRKRWPVASLGGVFTFRRCTGEGIADRWMKPENIITRMRADGGRIRLNAGGGHRSLKNVFQEAGLPPWERERLPLIYVGGTLACVPGIGVDLAFRANAGELGWRVRWRPESSP
ncbi:MAG: tRNA lysidine(34) synthetase TilS [Burkholderiales bacterium]